MTNNKNKAKQIMVAYSTAEISQHFLEQNVIDPCTRYITVSVLSTVPSEEKKRKKKKDKYNIQQPNDVGEQKRKDRVIFYVAYIVDLMLQQLPVSSLFVFAFV